MCPLSSRQRKKQKEYVKQIDSFISPCCAAGRDFSSRGGGEEILARRHAIQTLLVTASVVKVYVIFNSGNKRIAARELFKIVHFGLQNAPPTLHRSVVKTSSNTGHTLNHACINKLLMKCFVSVLESSVAMEDWL